LRSTGAGVAGGLLATRTARPTVAQEGTHVTVVVPEEPPDLDPFYYALSHIPVTRNIYDALVMREAQSADLLPGLATEWETTSPTTWQFTLRDDVVYHNGNPFNAEAAAYVINYVMNNETNATSAFQPGTEASAVEEFLLEVTTPEPDPILPLLLYAVSIPEPESWEADPVGSMRAPVGTGPYRLVEFRGGDRITVEAFPDYWGEPGDVTTADFVYRNESAVRVSMIEAGEADIASMIAPQDAEQATVVAQTIPETPFLRLDVGSPPLDDLRIRQAIDCGIDRDELVRTVFGGYAVPAGTIIAPGVIGFNPDLTPTPYDPQKATDLVAEAAADGAPIDLELTIFGRNGIYPNAAEAMDIVQAWLLQAGLNVTVNMMDVLAWTDVILQEKPIPADRRGIIQSSAGGELGDSAGAAIGYMTSDGPQSPISDPVVDEMVAEARVLSGDERDQAFQEVFAYVHENLLPVVPMVHLQTIYALSDRIIWEPRTDNLILLKDIQFK
jgi:peptide/nickel transport system substrate-binding protein